MADTRLKSKIISLNGKLIASEDPATIGDNFQTLKNMRYTDTHIKGIGGMTKINSAPPSTYIKPRSGIHFQKQQPTEDHVLVQMYNTGLSASQVLDNTMTPPSTGNFSATSLWTDSPGAGQGRFSMAPGGNVAYCNGVDSCIWGGNEMRVARYINYDPNGTFSYDYTDVVNNSLTSSDPGGSINVAACNIVPASIDSSTKLLYHLDGTTGSTTVTDSSASAHASTASGGFQIYNGVTPVDKFSGSGLFNGTNAIIGTSSAHADFNMNGGVFTVDGWFQPETDGTSFILWEMYSGTDDFIRLTMDAAYIPSAATLTLSIVVGTVTKVSFSSSAAVAFGVWNHIAVVENGNDFYIFVNGAIVGQTSDADRATNASMKVAVGANPYTGSYFQGYVDEFRVSKGVARWIAQFNPPVAPYSSANIFYANIGPLRPLKGFKVYIGTANNSTASLVVEYWNGSEWVAVSSLSDGTSVTGKTLAQTGNITFTSTESVAKVRSINKIVLYWYRISASGLNSSTTIRQITVDAPFQSVKDIWDGELRKELSFQVYKAGSTASYTDYTVNVFDDTVDSLNTFTYVDLNALTTATEHFIAGFDEQMMGLEFHIVGPGNSVVNTVMTVYYWNGTAWTAINTVYNPELLDDGTSNSGKSFSQSGTVSWNPPAITSEFRKTINNGFSLFYYKVSFNQTFTTSTKLFYVAGIPAQTRILGYKFPIFSNDRLVLCNEVSRDKNKAIVTALHTADVHNGDHIEDFYFGDETGLTAGISLYNEIGNQLRHMTIITKINETWVLEGNDTSTWLQYLLSDRIGCNAPLTMAKTHIGNDAMQQAAIFQGAKGLYLCDGRNIIPIHWDIRNYFDDRDSNSINVTYAMNSTGYVDHEKFEYHWSFVSGNATTLNKEMVYDIRRQKWFEIDRGTGNYLQVAFNVKDVNGYEYSYGGIDTGYIERLENGNDFDGTAIVHMFQTGDISLASLMYTTIIRKVKMLFTAKTVTTNNATLTHYGNTSTSGTAITAMSPVSSGNRVADIIKGSNLGKHVLNSFKGAMTTNNETIGFEPIAIGVFYEDSGEDLN